MRSVRALARSTPGFWCHYAAVECVHDGCRAVAQSQLDEDVPDVSFHGHRRNRQLEADLGIGASLADERERIDLAAVSCSTGTRLLRGVVVR